MLAGLETRGRSCRPGAQGVSAERQVAWSPLFCVAPASRRALRPPLSLHSTLQCLCCTGVCTERGGEKGKPLEKQVYK